MGGLAVVPSHWTVGSTALPIAVMCPSPPVVSTQAELDKLLARMGAYKASQKLAGKDVSAAMARDQKSIDRSLPLWLGVLAAYVRVYACKGGAQHTGVKGSGGEGVGL